MKYFLSFVILSFIHLVAISNDIDAVKMLAKRIAPAFSENIIFSTIPSSGNDVFELKWQNNKLISLLFAAITPTRWRLV
ncbi:MAG: hypothetical protein E6H06_20770 [Bacteroidetes bacterium]|nr:MAG: hypothetical protein E6H06_20770 [Bacteroidota bacterium]